MITTQETNVAVSGLTVVEFDRRYPFYGIRNDSSSAIQVSTVNAECVEGADGVVTVAKDSSFVIANCGDKFNGTMLYLNGNGTVTVVGQYSDSNRFNVAKKGGDLEAKITQEATTRAAADAALNSRIDNIVSGATTDTEIIDARTDASGAVFSSLKARLDGENSEIKGSVSELREEVEDLVDFGKMQYIDPKTAEANTIWRNLPNGLTRASGFDNYTTFSAFAVKKGTYYISKNIWHKYSWAKSDNGTTTSLNIIDGASGDTYKGVISFSQNVELYISVQTSELPLMIVDGKVEPTEYHDKGVYGKRVNGNYRIDNYTLSEIEKASINDFSEIDYFFVKKGKLVCNNSMRTSSGAVAKYAKIDMRSDVKKAMCKFTSRGGGNVTLISTQLDTDNNVQDIVNKSIHCIFGMSSCVAQIYLNGTAKTLGSITYPILNNDDTTEYECGFEIINNNTLRLYAPNGETLDCTGDWSEYNGKFFIYEEYNGKPNIGDITSEWERPSIIAVFCKPTNGHCLRDEFKNYPSGYIPCVAPSGHVYTNFRNVAADDNKYVNANGTHDN